MDEKQVGFPPEFVRTIFWSCDYAKVRFVSNRSINPNHVRRLAANMKANGYYTDKPIALTRDWEVIDGQHRVKAAEMAGVSFAYVVVDGLTVEDVCRRGGGSQEQWSTLDYLTFYEAVGNTNYRRFREVIEDEGLSVHFAVRTLLGGSGDKSRSAFRKGEFVFDDAEESRLQVVLKALKDLRPYFPTALHDAGFASAVRVMVGHPGYDHKKMLYKLEVGGAAFHRSPTTRGYLEQLEAVYNRKNTQANRVRFAE